MAALQKIRSRGILLMIIIGVGLFAFIAEGLFQSIRQTLFSDRQRVGEVYGKTLSIQEFQKRVEMLSDVAKLQKRMNGQPDALSDQEQDQIRNQVWSNFLNTEAIRHEAKEAGIQVTDEDIQQALMTGQARSLQLLASLGFANQKTGLFDYRILQDFLKNYDMQVNQLLRAGRTDQVEQMAQIKKIWAYTEKQLKNEILKSKFYTLLSAATSSDAAIAKYDFDARSTQITASVVAVPYSAVSDKEANVTDEDIKNVYDEYKPLFKNPFESADLELLDVQVLPSAADKASLMNEVKGYQEQLTKVADPAGIVGSSPTVFPYSDISMSKNAFRQMPDVASALDSIPVGTVKPAYYNPQDNTVTTFKLLSKSQLPDSIQYRAIVAMGKTPEESAKLADSILTQLKGGAKYADIAKKYQQPDTYTWMTGAQFEAPGIPADQAEMIAKLENAPEGYSIVSNKKSYLVADVKARKSMVTKYNVAVIKCPLNFSKETYSIALNKINKFLSENRTLKSIKANAGKAGYLLRDVPNYSKASLMIQQQIGGNGAKEAIKWVFNDASAGDVSQLYECGRNNDHLLVVGVNGLTKSDYLPWNNPAVKAVLTKIALRDKKGDVLMARLKNVRTIAQMKGQKGMVAEQLENQTFASNPMLKAIGVAEPKLAGALYRTSPGDVTGLVKGAGAVYLAQVLQRVGSKEKMNLQQEEMQERGQLFQNILSQSYYGVNENLINTLISKYGKLKNNRYNF